MLGLHESGAGYVITIVMIESNLTVMIELS